MSTDGRSSIDITFVVPCFNAGGLLKEAIDSIKSQNGSFRIPEIVVVDDYSTDDATIAALNQLKADAGVTVVSNTRSRGPAGARNYGVSLAKSPWISFLDADDVLPADSVQCRVQAIPDDTEKECFIGADHILWWGASKFEDNSFFSSRPTVAAILREAFETGDPLRLTRPALQFLQAALCMCQTILLSRSLFINVGGFDESLQYCEDHQFLIRLADVADFVFVPRIVMWYRQHERSLTSQSFSPSEVYGKALRRLLNSGCCPDLHHAIRRRLPQLDVATAVWHRSRSEFAAASQSAAKAIRGKPMYPAGWKQYIAARLRLP